MVVSLDESSLQAAATMANATPVAMSTRFFMMFSRRRSYTFTLPATT
jgi:hypothetical protein